MQKRSNHTKSIILERNEYNVVVIAMFCVFVFGGLLLAGCADKTADTTDTADDTLIEEIEVPENIEETIAEDEYSSSEEETLVEEPLETTETEETVEITETEAAAGEEEYGEGKDISDISMSEPEDEFAAAKLGTPLEIPLHSENNCIGFLTGNPDEASTVFVIGGGWIRPHPGPFAWQWIEPEKGKLNFKETDEWVTTAQEYEIATLGTIWPYADWDQKTCRDLNDLNIAASCEVTQEDQFYPHTYKEGMVTKQFGIPTSRCAPCNMNNYKEFITKVVERYDGDGKDDMPGLSVPIKYWEVLNEPEMNEQTLTFFKGTPEEYVRILKETNEAIKTACPDCKTVQGGAAGNAPQMLSYWKKVFELGGAQYFDIANIHYIGAGDLATLNVKDFKKIIQGTGASGANKPIWVTEAEYRAESEVEQSMEGALKEGASKIFFTRFKISQKGPPMLGDYSEVYDSAVLKCK